MWCQFGPETYIRVKGKWVYLFQATDSTGATQRKPTSRTDALYSVVSSRCTPRKAPERRHVDGVQSGERILQLRARRPIDNEACRLYQFDESRGKVRAERLHVGHSGGGVLVALIEMADLSIITDCPRG
jgi:hypothetical protein